MLNEAQRAALTSEFHETMLDVYRRAKSECGYNAAYFLKMLAEHGGHSTAKQLLATEDPQSGFLELWRCGRLDLTVEAQVIDPKYRDLFERGELHQARFRLAALGYDA